jgi:serine/threonine-protein kinase
MAPEVIAEISADQRADIFSVGIVLAELLMIRRLFIAHNELDVLIQVRDANLRRLDKYGGHIQPELREVLSSALARERGHRYQDASAFREALHRYLFDQRLMVRNNDVRRFLERLAKKQASAEEPKAHTGAEPLQIRRSAVGGSLPAAGRDAATKGAAVERPAAAAAEGRGDRRTTGQRGQAVAQTSIRRKRKISFGPPPPPNPVPSTIPETGEEPRLSTEEALAAVPEVEEDGSLSAHDFFTMDTRETILLPSSDDLGAPMEARQVAASRVADSQEALAAGKGADVEGRLQECSLVRTLFDLAVEEETGLLVLRHDEVIKEIYLVDGDPEFVVSNQPGELFGQYLVTHRVVSDGELAMALAMLPHFEGKLGSALVELNLLRPVEVIRHLTRQVRQKLLEAFNWDAGLYAYFKGQTTDRESAPLGLDAFELVGSGVRQMSAQLLQARIEPLRYRRIRSISPLRVPPEVFRLGGDVRRVYDRLDGHRTLAELLDRYDDEEECDVFTRIVYLLVETGMAEADRAE